MTAMMGHKRSIAKKNTKFTEMVFSIICRQIKIATVRGPPFIDGIHFKGSGVTGLAH